MAKLYGLNNAVDFSAKNLINFTSIFMNHNIIFYNAYK